jgi:hypothetical protein
MADQTPARVMGGLWAVMGAACLLFPNPVLKLSTHERILPAKEEPSELSSFVFRCFGSQALVVGLLLSTCTLDTRAYKLFGLSILPFVAFDIAAYRGEYLNALGAAGDGFGNAVFLACSAMGAGLLSSKGKSA